MRILWHSAAPWAGTGYGQQTAIWCRYLKAQGHDVAISTYFGAPGNTTKWEGMTVYCPPQDGIVTQLIPGHAKKHKADLIIVLADVWLMDPRLFGQFKTLVWMPCDAKPLSQGDMHFLMNAAKNGIDLKVIAMSEAGRETIQAAGYEAEYIPHGIDTSIFKPDEHREELRAAFGIPEGTFAIGINANNIDPVRKAYPEQFSAFAQFNRKHPNSVLFVHAMVRVDRSLDLQVLATTLGIQDSVRFADQYRIQAGEFDTAHMARWYSALDLLSNATYGEGFGLPAIEAQACGTPVVLSNGTSGSQLAGPGWLAPTEPYWNLVHASWWHRPSIQGLAKAYEKAYTSRTTFKSQACRAFAKKYDIQEVGPMWDKLLESI